MKYILLRTKRFCGFITGFVFFLGGIVKLMDPAGAGLVMKEYLDFLHMGFLESAAKPLGVLFAFFETGIGAALITGVWRKVIGIAALALQGFFTLLTLLLVIFNPPMDCGCFGEAIHLTHTQTFLKNIVLCILLSANYFPTKCLGRPLKKKYVSFSVVMASVLAFTIYSWIYIPLIDFTDFKPAAALQAGSAFAVDEEEMYEAVFTYEKDGRQEKFDLMHLPDSTWTFVSTETVLKEEFKRTTVNLSFFDADGVYHDAKAAEGKVMLISVYDPEMNITGWNNTAKFLNNAESTGFTPLLLVSSTPEEMDRILSPLDPGTAEILRKHLYFSDYKTLITMNRSNSGATYFSEGYLIRKWARAAIPDAEELEEVYSGDDTEVVIWHDTRGSLGFQGFLLYVFAVMLLL